MLMQILHGGGVPPTRGGSWAEGLANATQPIFQAIMAKQLMGQDAALEKAKEAKYTAGITEVLGGQPDQRFSSYYPASVSPQTQPGSQQAIIQAMKANPRGSGDISAMGKILLGESPEYMSPQAGVDAENNPAFFQASKTGGEPKLVPGYRPPPQATPAKNGTWMMDLKSGKPVMKTDADAMAAPGAFGPIPNGMRLIVGENGEVEFSTGGIQPGLTKGIQGKLEDAVIQGTDALARLNTIKLKFKPEYQQLGTRWENLLATTKDKLGVPLDEVTKKNLAGFTSYKRDSIENMNKTIRDITGATMNADEVPRLMGQMPVAGTSLFDGDSPIEFTAKMDGVLASVEASIARAQYAKEHKLSKAAQFAIPLEAVPKMISARGDELAASLKAQNPQMPDEQIKEMVKNRLRQEFGL